jgi:voltage-gated potassium channel
MIDVMLLILQRLRAPLITMIVVYAISVLGLTLIPGKDASGQVIEMGFFHAFYVMSYTATTIGFGEIPHAFTDAQRLWVTFCIYLSVVGWAYTLGAVVALTSDSSFRELMARSLFIWRVRSQGEPFYIICGYGQSGALVAKALDKLGYSLVIVESRPERARMIAVEVFETHPLVLAADARTADILEDAGVRNPLCIGLLALAGEDNVNQAIAIGAKTMCPELAVVSRAKQPMAKANLEAFGGITVINPFETFAANLVLDLHAPDVLRLEEWLTAPLGALCLPSYGLPKGLWILIGYGRFGTAIAKVLDREGIPWRAIDTKLNLNTGSRLLDGDDAEAALLKAGIHEADVLVAGSDNDAVNLGYITLARRRHEAVFVVMRQNHVKDRILVEAARANLKFVQSELMVHECLQRLRSPLFQRFIAQLRTEHQAAAGHLLATIQKQLGPGSPEIWTFGCDVLQAGMFSVFFQKPSFTLRLKHLGLNPSLPSLALEALPLALERQGVLSLLPDPEMPLKAGDQILYLGSPEAMREQGRYLNDPNAVTHACTGVEPPKGWVFTWLRKKGWLTGPHLGAKP